jgi:hypothetical protein
VGSSSLSALWKVLTNLSGAEALLFGFLVLCALGGAAVAIYTGLRAIMDSRRERRGSRRGRPHVNGQA